MAGSRLHLAEFGGKTGLMTQGAVGERLGVQVSEKKLSKEFSLSHRGRPRSSMAIGVKLDYMMP